MGILLEKVDGQGWDAAADEGTPVPLGRDISGANFPRKGMPKIF
jgi:hypothetical protein